MKEIEHLSLDGRALRVFLAVLDAGSVTLAAERLGITQSAVSHTLDKLRDITGDPLFVKAGRGIVATAHAKTLREPALAVLDGMKGIARGPRFDPLRAEHEFVVATNDYERDLLLPAAFQALSREAPRLRLKVIPAGIPGPELLRDDGCDLVICVEPPSGADILSNRLFDDQVVCFHDPAVRQAPANMDQYLAARHIGVHFESGARGNIERRFRDIGIHRDVAVVVNNLAGVPPFMRGTDLLATLPRKLEDGLMKEFAWSPTPFEAPPLPIHLVWHRRNHLDAAHRWLREQLERTARRIAGSGV